MTEPTEPTPPKRITKRKQAWLDAKAKHAEELQYLEKGGLPVEVMRERETEHQLSKRFNRPTSYGAEMVDEILDRLGNGESLGAICNSDPERYPRVTTFLNWVQNNHVPGLFEAYARARIVGAHAMADAIVTIADNASPFEEGVARLRMDARKWYVARVLPRIYGDKIDITSSGEKIVMAITKDDDDLC